ncbi:MAG: hypothetical protein HOE90_13380 [Bacteriovoracaceae bacterium]|jgi:hypothetical protein|nr:hypothetical protein [Bacteriovoracaceae bacterium]
MSMKDALKKAGYNSTKAQNERTVKATKQKKQSESHQEDRNFCEICNCYQRDVERFVHKNALISAEWICSNCADKSEIHDDFRTTQQSEFSKSKTYRRQYGPTKNFNAKNTQSKKHSPSPSPSKKPQKSGKKFNYDDDGEKNFNR